MTPDNKNIGHSVTNTRTIFRKGLILLTFRKQNRIKYIIFKSSSSKYNEVFHYYLYLIKELPVYRNTSLSPVVWLRPILYKQQTATENRFGGTEERYLFLLPGAWGLRPYHQPKQKTWNLTNHSRGPRTANQINHS